VQRCASKRVGRSWALALTAVAVAACSGPHGAGYPANPGTASRGSGTLTVSWSPPTKNTNGTPLTNLTGYTLLYGTASKTYSTAIPIDNPATTRYVVSGLRPGTYYFAISAINSSGRHSVLSAEAHGTVN
jgi:Fibronectin type III domain